MDFVGHPQKILKPMTENVPFSLLNYDQIIINFRKHELIQTKNRIDLWSISLILIFQIAQGHNHRGTHLSLVPPIMRHGYGIPTWVRLGPISHPKPQFLYHGPHHNTGPTSRRPLLWNIFLILLKNKISPSILNYYI